MKTLKTLLKAAKMIAKIYCTVSTIYTAIKFVKMRGLKRENDKELIQQALKVRTCVIWDDAINPEDVYESITINGEEAHIVFNPYIHLFMGAIGTIACCLEIYSEKYIVVDDQFRKLSRKAQIAVICHELGHMHHDHNAKIAEEGQMSYMLGRRKAAKSGEVYWMETEADEYACTLMFPTDWKEGISELQETIGLNRLTSDAWWELENRMSHITCNTDKICPGHLNIDSKLFKTMMDTRKLYN